MRRNEQVPLWSMLSKYASCVTFIGLSKPGRNSRAESTEVIVARNNELLPKGPFGNRYNSIVCRDFREILQIGSNLRGISEFMRIYLPKRLSGDPRFKLCPMRVHCVSVSRPSPFANADDAPFSRPAGHRASTRLSCRGRSGVRLIAKKSRVVFFSRHSIGIAKGMPLDKSDIFLVHSIGRVIVNSMFDSLVLLHHFHVCVSRL